MRILHLSDLHFGRTRPELIPVLTAQARALAPDVTVISGDLTQRAREWQFDAAETLIASLPGPVFCVPGNHDIPLDRPLSRLLRPFAAYRAAINADLEPLLDLPGLRLVGMNTADPRAWERGRIRRRSLRQAVARLEAAPPGALRVVVMHHPLVMPAGVAKEPTRRAAEAAESLALAGADLVLAGHLHLWSLATPLAEAGRRLLLVQAGTGLSTRLRGEENDFNLIAHDPPRPGTAAAAGRRSLSVTRYLARAEVDRFDEGPRATFIETASGWSQLMPGAPDPTRAEYNPA